MVKRGRLVRYMVAILLVGLSAGISSKAQSGQSEFGVGSIHKGLAIGAIVGIAAAAGAGITYVVLHNRGVVVGCISETGRRRTFRAAHNRVYSLWDGGPSQSIPVGHRLKVKGHKSGSASDPSFQIQKVLKDYGPC